MLQLVAKNGVFQGLAWPITVQPLTLGRDHACAIYLNDPMVSRRHCNVFIQGGRAWLRDLDSRNATLVNGAPVKEGQLKPGDEIAVGGSIFLVTELRGKEKHAKPGKPGLSDTSSLKIKAPIYSSESGDSLLKKGTPHTTEELVHLFLLGRELSQTDSITGLITIALGKLTERFDPRVLWMVLADEPHTELIVYPGHESDVLRQDEALYPYVLKAIQDKRSLLLPQQFTLNDVQGIRTTIISPIVLGQEALGAVIAQAESPMRIYEESDLEFLIAHAYAMAPYIRAVTKLEKLEVENRRFVAGIAHQGPIIGVSPALSAVRTQARDVAKSRLSVLILGETGTGKELVARMIHELSELSDMPMVIVNCAAIPDELFESEVFGHERGAFTGAHATKKGLFEESDGGALFLDEVGDLSLPNQARLLRAIETGTYRRLGGATVLQATVRFLAATNKDLEEEVEGGRFRRDLYHRLHGFELCIPPLRERRADIPALAEHFRSIAVKRDARGPAGFTPEALRALERHPWPGNVRELRNIIERAVVVAKSAYIGEADLGLNSGIKLAVPFVTLQDLEKRHIMEALERARGNVKAAANLLGIGRSTLYRKLTEFNITV